MQELTALPVCFGDLDQPNVILCAGIYMKLQIKLQPYLWKESSIRIRDWQVATSHSNMLKLKYIRVTRRANRQNECREATETAIHLQCYMDLAQEKVAFSWLSALPIDGHGFALHKSFAFRDALSLQCWWPLENLPSHCSCGHQFNAKQTLSYSFRGFPPSGMRRELNIEPHLQT